MSQIFQRLVEYYLHQFVILDFQFLSSKPMNWSGNVVSALNWIRPVCKNCVLVSYNRVGTESNSYNPHLSKRVLDVGICSLRGAT